MHIFAAHFSRSCRADGLPFYIGTIAPVMLIFVFNWVMYGCIITSVFLRLRSAAKVTNTDVSFRKLAWTAAVLSVVFGLGWGFGLAQTSVPECSGTAANVTLFILQVLFGLLVGSQGVLMFIFYGVGNKKVREVWKRWFLKRQYTKVLVDLFSRSAVPDSSKTITVASSNIYSEMTIQASVRESETLHDEEQKETKFVEVETEVEKSSNDWKSSGETDLTTEDPKKVKEEVGDTDVVS